MDTDEFLRYRHFRSGQAKSQAFSDLIDGIFGLILSDPWNCALSPPIRLIERHSKTNYFFVPFSF
jgi:hypothetical protein